MASGIDFMFKVYRNGEHVGFLGQSWADYEGFKCRFVDWENERGGGDYTKIFDNDEYSLQIISYERWHHDLRFPTLQGISHQDLKKTNDKHILSKGDKELLREPFRFIGYKNGEHLFLPYYYFLFNKYVVERHT